MGAVTGGDGRHLEEELERWLSAGVITTDEADAIRHLEAEATEAREAAAPAPPMPMPPAPAPAPSRIPLVAEALGFLGGALAITAGIVATSQFWDEFSTAARLVLLGAVTGLLVVAGLVVRREGERALAHLGSFLWLLATGTTAFWTVIFTVDVAGWDGVDVVLATGAATSVVAAALWAWRPAPLQHVATFIALAVTVAAVAGQVEHVGGRFIGIALWAFGVVWLVLAWTGLVKPVSLGYALGGVLTIAAGRVLGGESAALDILTIATALALLAASVPTRSMTLLWVGVIGVIAAVPTTITEYFGSSLGAPVVLFLAGMSLIGVAVVASRIAREVRAVPPAAPRLSQPAIAATIVGVVALVVVLTVALTDITPVPAFPSLRATPDTAIPGAIAFVRGEGDQSCVYLAAASGATPVRTLHCEAGIDQGFPALSWNAAGNLTAHTYGKAGAQSVEIDPATGAVVTREPAGDLGKGPLEKVRRTSDGAYIETDNSTAGTPKVAVRTGVGSARTVYSTTGPQDYRFEDAIWSPDGRYAAVIDSEQRLLIVDVASSSPTARLLTADAGAPAWGA